MTMKFPTQFTDSRAFDIARALLEGFDRHYRLFRATSAAAKTRFETADWHGQQRAQRERIEYYDRRVDEAVERLQREFDINHLSMDSWQQAKLHYIGLLTNHHQPELAETFFNSVTTKILHRDYFRNDFIFVRPAVSTEYIENDEPASLPTYRAYYPTRDSLRESLLRMINNCQLERAFEDLGRDVDQVVAALRAHTGEVRLRTNYQVQVLSSLFFRNKGAYVVGKIVNGFNETPFALPILHTAGGELAIDAALFGEDDLLMLFSFARAYFMVDMEIPSAYVQFLRSLMPRKPRSEIYSALGLQKQGKNLFYDAKGQDQMSKPAWSFIERILASGQEICLVLNPSVNAYRRLDPHYEAPNQIKASAVNRGAMVRIPIGNAQSARVEVRSIAPDANPYLAIFTMFKVGLEGPIEAANGDKKRDRTKFLPDNIFDALRMFKASKVATDLLGETVHKKYADLKLMQAERCPKSLGTRIKIPEIQFHHEVTNQYLWSQF